MRPAFLLRHATVTMPATSRTRRRSAAGSRYGNSCGGFNVPGDYFWQCVDALSAAFDGNPMTTEDNLTLYLNQCVELPADARLERRRQMVQIIGGLAQLQTRLTELG
jgi:hypothetical protein